MKVRVDSDVCQGHARCVILGPDVFDLDKDGYCVIPKADLPPELEQQARDGADACPEQAITVEE